MSEREPTAAIDIDTRKAALEVVSTLVNVKKVAADRLSWPAGVPDALIEHFVRGKDATTGESLSKRQAGSSILSRTCPVG